jgi:hypothetical protein
MRGKKNEMSVVCFWSQHPERLLQTINNFVRSRSMEMERDLFFLGPKKSRLI